MVKLLALAALFLATTHAAVSFSDDFVSGFESGIFLRTKEDREEYGCPEPKSDGAAMMGLPDMMTPLKMMGAFVQDQNIKAVVDIVGVFIESVSQLMAVFMNQYEGDDFCSGLIFGSNGAQMLVNIAKTFMQVRNHMGAGSITATPSNKDLLPASPPKARGASSSSKSSKASESSGSVKANLKTSTAKATSSGSRRSSGYSDSDDV